jgi:hypothetical protein
MSALSAGIWPWVPAGLLASMLAGLGSMALIAIRDPGFALERDYYAKAVHYDREIEQRAQNARLGWSAVSTVGAAVRGSTTRLDVQVRARSGLVSGARVSVQALRNASASTVLVAHCEESAPGRYHAELPLAHAGLWEFRFVVERGAERFTEVVRHDVMDGAP